MIIEQSFNGSGFWFQLGICYEKFIGNDGWGGVDGFNDFSAVYYPDYAEIRIRRAKIPITLTITDGLGADINYDMGNSVHSITLTPPSPGDSYDLATLRRRFV